MRSHFAYNFELWGSIFFIHVPNESYLHQLPVDIKCVEHWRYPLAAGTQTIKFNRKNDILVVYKITKSFLQQTITT